MPFVPNPAPGQIVASSWGGLVATQVVQTYATAAARAAALTSPAVGQVTARTDLAGGLEIWTGTAWVTVGPSPAQWSTYTPVWRAGGATGPAIGTGGFFQGRYKMIAPYTLAFFIDLTPGTSPTLGTGAYTFSLPGTYTLPSSVQVFHTMFTSGPIVGSGLISSSNNLLNPYFVGTNGVTTAVTNAAPGWVPTTRLGMAGVLNVNQQW